MSIALIGPPGAGKGTQAERLLEQFKVRHISTGDLIRKSLENQTGLGILARKYMAQGELVPDEVVEAMVEEYLRQSDHKGSILFDGFPRTRDQAGFLDEIFKEMGRELEGVIYLKVSDEEAMRRLPNRVICRQCRTPFHKTDNRFEHCASGRCEGEFLYQRDDDNPETIQARLKVFRRDTAMLVEYLQQNHSLIIVDGLGSIAQVNTRVVRAMRDLQAHRTRSASQAEIKTILDRKELTPALTPEQATHPSCDIILLGAPGSGKGTQAVQIGKKLNLRRIATGDLFRKNIENETALGKVAKSYMDRGELVPDNVTEAMVRERLSRSDTEAGFILDGFPRTLPQAEVLTEIMTDMQRRIDAVLYIKVSDEKIIGRLSERLICRECQSPFHNTHNPFKSCPYNKCSGQFLQQRDDDRPDTVRVRLRTFHRQTSPLISYYQEAGLLIEVDGEQDVFEVVSEVMAIIQEITEPAEVFEAGTTDRA